MANPNVRSQNLNQLNYSVGVAQVARFGPMQDVTGAALDLSAWNSIELQGYVNMQNQSTTQIGSAVAATGDSDGYVTVPMDGSDFSLAELQLQAQAKFFIQGKNLVGDPFILLGTGQLFIQNVT